MLCSVGDESARVTCTTKDVFSVHFKLLPERIEAMLERLKDGDQHARAVYALLKTAADAPDEAKPRGPRKAMDQLLAA